MDMGESGYHGYGDLPPPVSAPRSNIDILLTAAEQQNRIDSMMESGAAYSRSISGPYNEYGMCGALFLVFTYSLHEY